MVTGEACGFACCGGRRKRGTVFALGPEVPTNCRTLISLRVLASHGRFGTGGIPPNSGYTMEAGVALDSLHGIGISVRLHCGKASQIPVIVAPARVLQDVQTGYCTARKGDIAGQVLEIAIDAQELRMAWQGDTARPLPIPALPELVRPYIKLFEPRDAVELLSISIRGRPGAALAFALALKCISQRAEIAIPCDIASRIWSLSIAH